MQVPDCDSNASIARESAMNRDGNCTSAAGTNNGRNSVGCLAALFARAVDRPNGCPGTSASRGRCELEYDYREATTRRLSQLIARLHQMSGSASGPWAKS